MKRQYPKSTPLWRFAFVVYVAALLWLLFDRTPGWDNSSSYAEAMRGNMNLIPFHTLRNYWKVVCRMEFTPLFFHCVINLGGNIFLFILLILLKLYAIILECCIGLIKFQVHTLELLIYFVRFIQCLLNNSILRLQALLQESLHTPIGFLHVFFVVFPF